MTDSYWPAFPTPPKNGLQGEEGDFVFLHQFYTWFNSHVILLLWGFIKKSSLYLCSVLILILMCQHSMCSHFVYVFDIPILLSSKCSFQVLCVIKWNIYHLVQLINTYVLIFDFYYKYFMFKGDFGYPWPENVNYIRNNICIVTSCISITR